MPFRWISRRPVLREILVTGHYVCFYGIIWLIQRRLRPDLPEPLAGIAH